MGNIDLNKLRGIADKSVGFGKEIAGTFLGRDDLVESGQAQQDKATAALKALREEAKAQAHAAEAEAHERRQRAAQQAKA